jgi:hypothetical protein
MASVVPYHVGTLNYADREEDEEAYVSDLESRVMATGPGTDSDFP